MESHLFNDTQSLQKLPIDLLFFFQLRIKFVAEENMFY